MGKKKTVRPVDAPNKTRVELRFDNDVYEGIKRLADDAQISVNQLMQGLARWAAQYGHAGEPERDDGGILRSRPQPGCVWVGRHGWKRSELGPEEYDEDLPEKEVGELRLFLDFTERRVLREMD